MIDRWIHRTRGQLRVRAEGAFPERILNLCSAHDLAFRDLEWKSGTEFLCRMSPEDWRKLKYLTESSDCDLQVVRREGVPFFLRRFRRRPILVTTAVFCAVWMLVGSFFIWDFQVTGNETVPAETILRALEKNGVTIGTFGLGIDGEELRNHVLLDVPELKWITVNVSGCRAEVEVRERTFPPEIVNRRDPTNLVARRAGLVQKVQAAGGCAAVQKGSTVERGQLLIGGVEDTGTFGAVLLQGMGSVQARTWYTLQTVVPAEARAKTDGGKMTGVSVVLGTHRIKFFSNSSIIDRNYDKITKRTQLSFFGLPLPVTVETEWFRFYETAPAVQNEQTAAQQAGEVLKEYLEQLTAPYGTVESVLLSSRRAENGLQITLRAECLEEIGQSVPIYTENDTGQPG